MCLCAAAALQELSVTGGLTGPHRPEGNPAPSMGAGNPSVGLGLFSPEFLFSLWCLLLHNMLLRSPADPSGMAVMLSWPLAPAAKRAAFLLLLLFSLSF